MQIKVEKMSEMIFLKMDLKKNGRVTLNDFQSCLQHNPNLLEVYEILNNGITDSKDGPLQTLAEKKLFKISHIVDLLILEIHKNSLALSSLNKYPTVFSVVSTVRDFPKDDDPEKTQPGFNPVMSAQIEPIQIDSDEDNFGAARVPPTMKFLTMVKEEKKNESSIRGGRVEGKQKRCFSMLNSTHTIKNFGKNQNIHQSFGGFYKKFIVC